MSKTEVTLSEGRREDLLSLINGGNRGDVAINALREELEQGNLSPGQIAELTALAQKYETPVTFESKSRDYGIQPSTSAQSPMVDFTLTVSRKVQAAAYLTELLGADAEVLFSDWGSRIDFTDYVPCSNKAMLVKDSNHKSRPTQERFLGECGLEFADDLQATLVCATLVKHAQEAGLDLSKPLSTWDTEQLGACSNLDENVLNLLAKLLNGVVRTKSGGLYLYDGGRLRTHNIGELPGRYIWAFGVSHNARNVK